VVGRLPRRPQDVLTWGRCQEASAVVRRADVDTPQLPLHDVMQQRYELIRPLLLLQERTARQRAQDTAPPRNGGRPQAPL
jgi:hypothetical protein